MTKAWTWHMNMTNVYATKNKPLFDRIALDELRLLLTKKRKVTYDLCGSPLCAVQRCLCVCLLRVLCACTSAQNLSQILSQTLSLRQRKNSNEKTQTEKSGRERKTANTQKQPVQIAISNNEIKQVSFSHCWHSKLI
jgi:hypothetical protein